jgi:phospholipid transport system transporter-binding protein
MLDGPVTLDTVPGLAAEMESLLDGEARVIDFGGATDVDSSAVALVLEWCHQAASRKLNLRVANLPTAMENLAKLYGVSDLLHPKTD